MTVFLGKNEPPSPEPLFAWKFWVVGAWTVLFFLELAANCSQLAVLRQKLTPMLSELVRDRNQQNGRSRTIYRIWAAWWSSAQVVWIVSKDAVPKLWDAVGMLQTRYHLIWTGDSEFDHAFLFVVGAWLGWYMLNIPNYLIRTLIFKESVIQDFYSKKNRNWMLHEAIKGRPTPFILLITAVSVMWLMANGKVINGNFTLGAAVLQLVLMLLYHGLSQPRGKALCQLKSGSTRDAIEEVASTAGFPLENVFVIDGHADTPIVQTTGWLCQRSIIIHSALLEECDTKDIVALIAQRLGWWKSCSGLIRLIIAQLMANNQWVFMVMFIKNQRNYRAFGFVTEFPTIAALVLYAIAIAPIIAVWSRLQIHNVSRAHEFAADKYAAALGYSSDLSEALIKISGAGLIPQPVSRFYSMYYLDVPALSHRVEALAKLRELEDEKEGMITLHLDEKK